MVRKFRRLLKGKMLVGGGVGGGSAEKESYSAIETDALSEEIQPEFEIKDGVADVSIPEELLVDPLWKFLVVGII